MMHDILYTLVRKLYRGKTGHNLVYQFGWYIFFSLHPNVQMYCLIFFLEIFIINKTMIIIIE